MSASVPSARPPSAPGAPVAPAPQDEEPGRHECPRCARAFARRAYLALHLGREHDEPLSVEEQAAFDAALAHEQAWLADLRRHARATLKVLPLVFFAFVFAAVAINANVNAAFVVLVMPPSLVAVAILYYLTYESG